MCTCTKEGPVCQSLKIENCFHLAQTFSQKDILQDHVCKVQCAFAFRAFPKVRFFYIFVNLNLRALYLKCREGHKKCLISRKKIKIVIITSYYRQLFADIKIKNYKVQISFISSEKPKDRANKTGINFMNLYKNS